MSTSTSPVLAPAADPRAAAMESGLFTVLKPTIEAVDANIKSVFDSQAFLDSQLSKLEQGTPSSNITQKSPNQLELRYGILPLGFYYQSCSFPLAHLFRSSALPFVSCFPRLLSSIFSVLFLSADCGQGCPGASVVHGVLRQARRDAPPHCRAAGRHCPRRRPTGEAARTGPRALRRRHRRRCPGFRRADRASRSHHHRSRNRCPCHCPSDCECERECEREGAGGPPCCCACARSGGGGGGGQL